MTEWMTALGVLDLGKMGDRLQLVARYAGRYNLDPALVCALAEQESSWNPWANRYERGFYSRYILPLGLADNTESRMRATSWGLLQVMGQVAREHGFVGPFFSELCRPDIGLEFGCRVFADKLGRHALDVPKALLAYNGGDDAQYPQRVLERLPKYREVANVGHS